MTDRWTTPCARLLVARPWHTLLVALAILLIAGARIPDLRLTAPADNLLLRDTAPPATAGTSPAAAPDVLTVTYRPLGDDLMSEPALARIAQLRDALAAVPGVQAVGTLLEAPLLFSPAVRFADVAGPLQHVQETGVDTDLARAEFRQSPLYRNWLLAADGQQTALRVTLQPQAARELLRGQGSVAQDLESVLAAHREHAAIFLGGAPLVAAGMPAALHADFVRLAAPAMGAMFLVLVVLWRRPGWALLPPVAGMAGSLLLLGVLSWSARPLGVVAAYAVPATLLLAAGVAIRLVERFRALAASGSVQAPRERAAAALVDLLPPAAAACGVAMLVSAALALGGPGPVAELGRTALLGAPLALLAATAISPALLVACGAPRAAPASAALASLGALEGIARRFGATLLLLSLALLAVGVAGVRELRPEDRLLGRFAPTSAFHQGMAAIDREFGGLTPLTIVLDAEPAWPAGAGTDNPWYSAQGFARVAAAQDLLAAHEEVASVRSLASFGAAAAELEGGPVDDEQLAAAWRDMPAARRALLLEPWLGPAPGQTLLAVGLRDTGAGTPRSELLQWVRAQLARELDIPGARLHIDAPLLPSQDVPGTLLRVQLFATVAASLVVAALALAWLRTPLAALLAPLPVLLSGVLASGTMGWLGVPLGSISVAFPAVALVACAANCIHYLWALRRRGAGGTLQGDAAAPPGAMCCILLAGGAALAVLLLAEFLPNRQLGLCAVTGLAIAGFAGALLLPRLLLPWLPTAALGAAAAGGFDHGDGLKRA